MRIAVFGSKAYDRCLLTAANRAYHHDLTFIEPRLDEATAMLATGFPAVCVFVNDRLDDAVAPLDVYEQEAHLFFEDLSNEIIQDDLFQCLLTFPNVIVTGHQVFLTEEALSAIDDTTLASLADTEAGRALQHRVGPEVIRSGEPR